MTARLLLLSAVLSACGGDGGMLSRSPDAATEGGTEGRAVIVATANGEIVQLAAGGDAAIAASDAGGGGDGSASDAGSAQASSDAGRTSDAATSTCQISDGCPLCFGAYPINCCRSGGACGCRYMNLACR